jgi:hypothetical protein
MKLNISFKMDRNTLIFLVIIVVLFFILMVGRNSSFISVNSYGNCSCPVSYYDRLPYYSVYETNYSPMKCCNFGDTDCHLDCVYVSGVI